MSSGKGTEGLWDGSLEEVTWRRRGEREGRGRGREERLEDLTASLSFSLFFFLLLLF